MRSLSVNYGSVYIYILLLITATGKGQESHCPGHKNVLFVETWSFLAERLS